MSNIDAASEPLCCPVNPKHGTNVPSANLGKYLSFSFSVPYFNNNSAGPNELGTITVTPTALEAVDIFCTI